MGNRITRLPPRWSINLCACHGWGICCITCCVPCITFGRNAEMIDAGESSCASQACIYCLLTLISCQCLLACIYREKLRSKFGLPAEPCCDFCVHCCCGCCALCQEHNELKYRGLDPSKGCTTAFLPCVTFGRNAEMIDEGKTSCVAHSFAYGMLMMVTCHCLLSCFYREKLRAKYGLPAAPCGDCCVHCLCEFCALCQEHAELKSRGLDPKKGWNTSSNVAPVQMRIYR